MTEDDVIRLLRKHMERQFPKTCNTCKRQFNTLEDYIRNTTHLGDPVSYDADDINPLHPPAAPIGTHTLANCPCGNTLSISSTGRNPIQVWQFLAWIQKEAVRRGIKPKAILLELRSKLEALVLQGDSSK